MKRLLITTLAVLLVSLVVGVAYSDEGDPVRNQIQTETPDHNYDDFETPGVPDNIGPDDRENNHRGDNGYKSIVPIISSFNERLGLFIIQFVMW
ncbi:MAG: hypothetical protein DRP71_14240 [Verrucomicrobia bacterium]|nr:MAG: hypothetical protein DRP71_14240 [Verrucomicrobiota bacterium]